MNILLILAIFWPALAGLVIFLMPSCKDNRQLRGRAVNAALAVELALTLIMCLGQGTNMVLLNMTPTLRIEMNVDMVGTTTTSACIRCSSCACSPRSSASATPARW